MPVLIQHYPMLQRNLLYTGVTRGKWAAVVEARRVALFGRHVKRAVDRLRNVKNPTNAPYRKCTLVGKNLD
jgi:exodeoxyribonuclease V alpha subunit